MVRDLRLLAAFALMTLLVSTVFFPTGCSSGGSPVIGPGGSDASMGGGDGATGDATGSNDGPSTGGCQSNGDCATSTKGHVCVSGTCQVCGANADCPTGQKCDAHTSCVACLTSADCSADQRCVNNACAMGCDAMSTCPASTVCDTATNACVGCLLDTDCTAPTGKCDTTNNTCVACLATSDCAAGTLCNANACVPGCTSTQPCPTGEVCNSGLCVQCTVNSQCHGATPWCDMTNNTCVQCLPSNDSCPTGEYCAGTACAPGCKSNLDCVAVADAGANDAASDASDAAVEAAADAASDAAGDAASDAASDAATEGGGGTSSGTVCDTTNHVCVECVVDANCPLGQTCSNSTCVAGCDASHGCPAGSGCCTGLCQKLNTLNNCTACGAACDTTSGNSQGAACGLGGCTYTGCAASWGDCSSGAPDSDGCETNLTTANERLCSDGTCVSTATCCTGIDCTTPPGPGACFPAHGSCPSEGAACNYAQNTGSVICNGTTCCNPINGSCDNSCNLTCSTGFGHCTTDPSDGCESNLTTCVNSPCCTSGLCNVHSNGQGQTYTDCVDPAGVAGSGSTYNVTMADDAAKAWAAAGTIAAVVCGGNSCISSITGSGATGHCVVWCYTGTLAGYQLETAANKCTCPTTASTPTWH